MTRSGTDIENHPVHPDVKVNAGIKYSNEFAELDACIAAHCDPWLWYNGEYPGWFMARILTWHRKKAAISLNVEDARYRQMKRKSKK